LTGCGKRCGHGRSRSGEMAPTRRVCHEDLVMQQD
jgi:hypothetical protein